MDPPSLLFDGRQQAIVVHAPSSPLLNTPSIFPTQCRPVNINFVHFGQLPRGRKTREGRNIPRASSGFRHHAQQESSLSFPISRSEDFFPAKRRECHLAVIVKNPCLYPPQAYPNFLTVAASWSSLP
ncbi:uncharacterized protein SCHCODRAFT_02610626 [Schizophyllum commune H4-8]|uniref:Expressed protein n=1 Tax=Schizophyllum commune (strain H4-8 / FGSC 9210) TaxID=578458 RepID=D8PRU1_SCHCM|nr:uncharacterized protein SCHCODRAFT_02610626 [Schizophyllum commune H4-8]KAI5897923.1 hypothetical protein SCHCODRAFT_02610626 [Schizophyllum commune H4-8]